MKSKDGGIKHQVEDLSGKIRVLLQSFGALCHVVQYIQSAMPPSFVGSNIMDSSSSRAASVANTNSLGQPPSPAHPISPARSAAGPIPPHLGKVLLDDIVMPFEKTIKANRLVETFRDVGVGGYVVHPRMCIKFD